jgi:citrate lyase subunit beta/citryl-CoA lyase
MVAPPAWSHTTQNLARLPTSLQVGNSQRLRIITAHAEAVAAGKGLVLVDGRLVENLHVQDAHRIVALADAIASLDHGNDS